MKLYHFTYPENLFRIHLRGLEPGIHNSGPIRGWIGRQWVSRWRRIKVRRIASVRCSEARHEAEYKRVATHPPRAA
jgi:hypothetical protein